MIGRRVAMVVAGAAVVAAAAGCRTLARQAFANPVVEVKDARITAIGFDGGAVDVILDVHNPNEYRLDATRISYRLWVDTTEVATGAIDQRVTLTERGRSEVVVPVRFTFAAVRDALLQMTLRGSIDYRITGQFTMVTPFGNITRPYSGTGRLDAIR